MPEFTQFESGKSIILYLPPYGTAGLAMFFVRIPKDQVMKIDTVICLFEGGGVSQQFRSGEYALCADYIFHRRTFVNMCSTIIKGRLKEMVPQKIRLKLKSIFQRNSYID